MVISDVLQTKGHAVVRVRPTDSIELAVAGSPSIASAPWWWRICG